MRLSWPVEKIERKAYELRIDALEAIHQAGSGHPGGSLSAAEIIACLYYHVMDIDPGRPSWAERDRFVLSKGHACPILYAALADRAFFPSRWLMRLRRLGQQLQGHPDCRTTPGIDFCTGSLGQGLSAGVGMAMASKYLGIKSRIYVVLGDGDVQEGQTWEAAMVAAHYKLDNLCAIYDSNGLQGEGPVDVIMDVRDVSQKFQAFGWGTVTVDGHDVARLIDAFNRAEHVKGMPFLIMAQTVKGKGVSFMEHQAEWHGSRAPSVEQLGQARQELQAKMDQMRAMQRR